MSKRGSVQLLLLFFRSRRRRPWIGATLTCLALLGLLHGEAPGLKSDIAQSLRQKAWEHALAGEPVQEPWPWDGVAPAAHAPVPRLGLSAAILTNADWGPPPGSTRHSRADARDPHLDLGDVAVGDSIAVTGADGLTQLYRVTRRNVIDPHLSAIEGALPEADPHLLTCTPPDPSVASALRLIIDAVHVPPRATVEPNPEQKL